MDKKAPHKALHDYFAHEARQHGASTVRGTLARNAADAAAELGGFDVASDVAPVEPEPEPAKPAKTRKKK